MALVADQKFSTFQDGGDLEVNDIIVGLRGGLNTRFTFTGELPPGVIVPIAQGGTGATTAAAARTNLGLGTIAVQDADAVAITGGSAILASGSVAAAPIAGIDIANKTYVDAHVAGTMSTTYVSTTPYNVLNTDDIILVDTATIGGASSIVLPMTPTQDGKVFTIKDFGFDATASNITISVAGGGDIDGSSTYVIADDNAAISIAWSAAEATYSTVYSLDTLIPVLRIAGNTGTTTAGSPVITISGGTTGLTTTASGSTLSLSGILIPANGGTGVSSVTTAPTATAFAGWDANSNLSANAFIDGFATTATAAGTTTLTVASKQIQEFTGATTQTVVMPVTSTLVAGMKWMIINNSSGNLTVNSSGANLILTMAANTTAWITCVLNSGTTAASWNSSYLYDLGAGVLSITGTANQVIASASTGNVTLSLPQSIATGSSPTFAGLTLTNPYIAGAGGLHSFQVFTSGTAQTYTRPSNVTSILVEVLGGGGGGGGGTGNGTGTGVAGGGGSGGYARLWIAAAASSYTYTVGALGAGGVAGNNKGSTGGTTTFGASLQATGGVGGNGMATTTAALTASGGSAGVGSNGDFNASGNPGGYSVCLVGSTGNAQFGRGGSSIYGGGANTVGGNAGNYGSGGAGAFATAANAAGGNGSAGLIVVWEFA